MAEAAGAAGGALAALSLLALAALLAFVLLRKRDGRGALGCCFGSGGGGGSRSSSSRKRFKVRQRARRARKGEGGQERHIDQHTHACFLSSLSLPLSRSLWLKGLRKSEGVRCLCRASQREERECVLSAQTKGR